MKRYFLVALTVLLVGVAGSLAFDAGKNYPSGNQEGIVAAPGNVIGCGKEKEIAGNNKVLWPDDNREPKDNGRTATVRKK